MLLAVLLLRAGEAVSTDVLTEHFAVGRTTATDGEGRPRQLRLAAAQGAGIGRAADSRPRLHAERES